MGGREGNLASKTQKKKNRGFQIVSALNTLPFLRWSFLPLGLGGVANAGRDGGRSGGKGFAGLLGRGKGDACNRPSILLLSLLREERKNLSKIERMRCIL